MKTIHKPLLLAASLTAFVTAQAWADATLFGEPSGDSRTDGDLVAGLAFNANTGGTAQINQLGYWDKDGDGLARDHVVGLFQRVTLDHPYYWKLLAKATVPAGTAAPLEGGYRWVSLPTTITLTDTTADGDYGRYAVLAEVGTDAWGNNPEGGGQPTFDPSIAASIAHYSSFWWAADPETPPATIGAVGSTHFFVGNGNVFAGPNARYVPPVGAPTTTTLERTAGAEPSNFVGGSPLTFTATVTGTAPTGDVEFFDGAIPLETKPLADVGGGVYQASLTTSTLAIGIHSITATYLGDGTNNAPSTSDPVTQTITDNRAITTTTLVLSSGTNPSDMDAPVTFTATVTGGSSPTGNVQFHDGTTLLDTKLLELVSGSYQASLTISTLNVGTHSMTATYIGDGANKPSTSDPALPHTVTGPIMLFGPLSGSPRTDAGHFGKGFDANSSGLAQINMLGIWDQGGDGLDNDHTVGLFERDPATPNYNWKLLAKVTVPAGTGAKLINGYRWVALPTAITLSETTSIGRAGDGRYAVIADVGGGTDAWYGFSDTTAPWSSFDTSIANNLGSIGGTGFGVTVSSMDVGTSYGFGGQGTILAGPNIGYVATASTFTITSSAGTGGSIDPLGAVDVPSGTDKLFSITANPGYMIDKVMVDGADKTADVISGSYTFTNVTATHTIAATFKTLFANWIGGYDVGTNTGQADDADGDGQNNLMEFALDGTPNNGALNGKVYLLTKASDYSTEKTLILTVAVRKGTVFDPGGPHVKPSANKDGVTYTIEGSLDLGDFSAPIWTNDMADSKNLHLNDGLPQPGPDYVYQSFTLEGSNGLPAVPGKGFLRVRVESTVP